MHVPPFRTFLPKRFAAAHGLPTGDTAAVNTGPVDTATVNTATVSRLREADQGELHDAYVYSINAAVSDGREDLADELARSFAREARHTARDRAAATQMLLLANR